MSKPKPFGRDGLVAQVRQVRLALAQVRWPYSQVRLGLSQVGLIDLILCFVRVVRFVGCPPDFPFFLLLFELRWETAAFRSHYAPGGYEPRC